MRGHLKTDGIYVKEVVGACIHSVGMNARPESGVEDGCKLTY